MSDAKRSVAPLLAGPMGLIAGSVTMFVFESTAASWWAFGITVAVFLMPALRTLSDGKGEG